jgi:hypothetical protein
MIPGHGLTVGKIILRLRCILILARIIRCYDALFTLRSTEYSKSLVHTTMADPQTPRWASRGVWTIIGLAVLKSFRLPKTHDPWPRAIITHLRRKKKKYNFCCAGYYSYMITHTPWTKFMMYWCISRMVADPADPSHSVERREVTYGVLVCWRHTYEVYVSVRVSDLSRLYLTGEACPESVTLSG